MPRFKTRILRLLPAAILAGTLFGCAEPGSGPVSDGPPAESADLSDIPDAVPREEPRSRYGNPSSYTVFGQRYTTLDSAAGYRERGIASWYGSKFHGRLTSSREPYDMYTMTAAHRSLPLPTYARVTNLNNGRSVVVRINDRGPFHPNRIIDLSYAAAGRLDMVRNGTGLVEVEALDPAASVPEPTPLDTAETSTATAPSPTARPLLYLQVGAFGNRDNAEKLQTRIVGRLQATVRIQEMASNPHPVYRVQIGPLADVEQADRLSTELGGLGIRESHVVIE